MLTLIAQAPPTPPGFWELLGAISLGGSAVVALIKLIDWFVGVKLAKPEAVAGCGVDPATRGKIQETARLLNETACCQERLADQLEKTNQTLDRMASSLERHGDLVRERQTGLFKALERIERKIEGA